MAIYQRYDSLPGLKATATLAAKQYYIVQASSTAGEVKVCTTPASDPVLGVVQNDPAAGEAADVAFSGVCKAAAETGVSFGDRVTCSATSRVKTTTTDGDRIVGIALAASTAAGDIIPLALSLHTEYVA
jgi:predicted RecA/RadA family phage recombinase